MTPCSKFEQKQTNPEKYSIKKLSLFDELQIRRISTVSAYTENSSLLLKWHSMGCTCLVLVIQCYPLAMDDLKSMLGNRIHPIDLLYVLCIQYNPYERGKQRASAKLNICNVDYRVDEDFTMYSIWFVYRLLIPSHINRIVFQNFLPKSIVIAIRWW